MKIQVVAGIIYNDRSELLIAQRPKGKHLANYWEFPGGKIEVNEKPLAALKRELLEELAIEMEEADFFKRISYQYPDKNILIDFYKIKLFLGNPVGREGQLVRWVSCSDLSKYCFPEANRAIINLLLSESFQ